MKEYRYKFEEYDGKDTRYHCPSCKNTVKTFVRYIDTETREYIHPSVGRCNREDSCGYHLTPKQFLPDNKIPMEVPQLYTKPKASIKPRQTSFIPFDTFRASVIGNNQNHLVTFLSNRFGEDVADGLVKRYFIGSSNHWEGSTVFWQIDTDYKVRTGKIMQYNPSTAKRVKEPTDRITWVHSALKLPEFALRQCFFGEHLLIDTSLPVRIVESEKTAIIASAYFPQFIWLATGMKGGLNADKCAILKGRSVTLFPDLKAFDLWSIKAKELSNITPMAVSDLLERTATNEEREQGLDVADYLLRFDLASFLQSGSTSTGDIISDDDRIESIQAGMERGYFDEMSLLYDNPVQDCTMNVIPGYYTPPDKPERVEKPLRPATGRLAELEDLFVIGERSQYYTTDTTLRKMTMRERYDIVRLLDSYKRTPPTNEQFQSLSSCIVSAVSNPGRSNTTLI